MLPINYYETSSLYFKYSYQSIIMKLRQGIDGSYQSIIMKLSLLKASVLPINYYETFS